MEFRDRPEIEAFRQEVRDWIKNDLTTEERGAYSPGDEIGDEVTASRVASVRSKMAARGWAAPAWPKEYGGMGATVRQQAVFNEELAYHRVPGPDFNGCHRRCDSRGQRQTGTV